MAAVACCRGLSQSVPRRFSSTFVQAQSRISVSPWRQPTRPSLLLAISYRSCCQPPFPTLALRNAAGKIRTFKHLSRPDRGSTLSTTPPSPSTSKPKDKPESGNPTAAEQRKNDWSIVKRLMINVWPKNDWKTRLTVLFGFVLLVMAKVCIAHIFTLL